MRNPREGNPVIVQDSNELEEVYVVFDGPPAHESGRFVETETEDGHGVGFRPAVAPDDFGVPRWERNTENGTWRLGPFLVRKNDSITQ